MASEEQTRRAIEEIIKALEPAIRRAFLESIADIRSAAQLEIIRAALESGDLAMALDALNIKPEMLAPLDQALSQAFLSGGRDALGLLPKLSAPSGGRAVMRFDGRNPRAEEWISQRSSTLVQEIVEDQRQGIREVLEDGMVQGINPRQVALNVTGRINKQTGRREGGLVGLHSQQMQWVRNMRDELADPDKMANYFTRKRRDRRLDHVVRKAMEAGKPLKKADIDRLTARYSDRLLAYRGELIARTEALSAFNAAQYEGIAQQIDAGVLDTQDVSKVWMAADDTRTRDSHNALDDMEVGFERPFMSPLTGAQMRYPTDTSLGARGSETISCRCSAFYRINYLARVGR